MRVNALKPMVSAQKKRLIEKRFRVVEENSRNRVMGKDRSVNMRANSSRKPPGDSAKAMLFAVKIAKVEATGGNHEKRHHIGTHMIYEK
jgi:hypothetical protein